VLKKTVLLVLLLGAAFGIMMLATRKTTFVVQTSGDMERPVSVVWQTLKAVETWPDWWPGVEKATLSAGLHKGAVLELVLTGNPDRETARVASVREERELAWTRPGVLASDTRTTVRLEASGPGTLVTVVSFIRGPQAFLARFTGRDEFVRYHKAILLQLKKFLENSRPDRNTGPGSPKSPHRPEPADGSKQREDR
jgi:hypothetical protein